MDFIKKKKKQLQPFFFRNNKKYQISSFASFIPNSAPDVYQYASSGTVF